MVSFNLETWDEDGVPAGSAADLDEVFEDVQSEEVSLFRRQWIIWNPIKHDFHHSGEVSLTLGAYQGEALDLC